MKYSNAIEVGVDQEAIENAAEDCVVGDMRTRLDTVVKYEVLIRQRFEHQRYLPTCYTN